MDNQCTRQIKKFLMEKDCDLMLVEPHNHSVNAAERAIQTFKDHFISALATTDSEFPLQLWDRLTPQAENTLNLMRASRTNPNMSAYDTIHGPYDWNRFPIAPLGCKAIIYESPKARGSWGTRGTDAWYLGPSLDHYRCNQYFVPETQAYRISGSAELFPQHCQVPYMTAKDQLKAVTKEMITTLTKLTATKQRQVLREVRAKLADDALRPCGPAFLTSPCHAWMLPDDNYQRAPQEAHTPVLQRVAPETQQRVGLTPHVNPAPSIQRMSNAPPIMKAPNSTMRRALKSTKQVHQRSTRNNIPGSVPAITRTQPLHSPQTDSNKTPIRRSPRLWNMSPQTDRTRLPQPYRKP
jgi:hypothetical protein